MLYRVYPSGFGKKLNALHDRAKLRPRLDLRQKARISPEKTDLDIFRSLPLDDAWTDAGMPSLFMYLWEHPSLEIPASWESTMIDFYKDMQALVP